MGTRLIYEGQKHEVCGWNNDQTSAIAQGEPVKINLAPIA